MRTLFAFFAISLVIISYFAIPFPWNVLVAFIAVILTLLESWERLRAARWRILAIIVVVSAIGALSYIGFASSTSLGLSFELFGRGYASGTNAEGIAWEPEYSDVRWTVANPSNIDYQDVDLTLNLGGGAVSSNAFFATVQQTGEQCSTQTLCDISTEGDLLVKNISTGELMMIPGEPFCQSSRERIRCNTLPHGSSFEFIAAIASIPDPTNTLVAPAKMPIILSVEGRYSIDLGPIGKKSMGVETTTVLFPSCSNINGNNFCN